MNFYCHPTCTTCKSAQKWLDKNDIDYNWINLKETTPSRETILSVMENSDRTVKSFFNTSGQKYREMNLKDKLSDMSLEEMAGLLANDGMLMKRPFAIDDGDNVTIGFKEQEYEKVWKS